MRIGTYCIRPNNEHTLTWITYGGHRAWVDVGIADEIMMLWQHDITTLYSCEGGMMGWKERYHSPRYLVIADARQKKRARKLLPWVVRSMKTPHSAGVAFYGQTLDQAELIAPDYDDHYEWYREFHGY